MAAATKSKPSPSPSMLDSVMNIDDKIPHLVIIARAGTGKTTTILGAITQLSGQVPRAANGRPLVPSPQQKAVWDEVSKSPKEASACFCAFNSAIADVMRKRLPSQYDARTVHSLGNMAVRSHFGGVSPHEDSLKMSTVEVMGVESRDVYRKGMNGLMYNVMAVVSKCKVNLIGTDWEYDSPEWIPAIRGIVDNYSIEVQDKQREELYRLVPLVLEKCKKPDRHISFDDMLWLPVVHDLDIPKFDLLFVDEAQDLSRCQQALIKKAGARLILCGDPAQCQPAGTLVRTTEKGLIPIEQLKVGDQLVSYSTQDGRFRGTRSQGRKVEKTASRNYKGDLYKVNGSRATANHRWLTRFRPDVPEEFTAVYVIELPDGTYRTGMTQLIIGGDHGFGPAMRARQRGATKLWVLKVCKTREEARELEFKTSVEFCIPQRAIYEGSEDRWCRDLVDDGVPPDIEGALRRFNKMLEHPLWSKDSSQHVGKYSYITQSCNLIEGVNQVCKWTSLTGTPRWVPIELSVETDWSGIVYSLQVQPTEGGRRLYVADDVVTHNSIYGFAGADSQSMARIEEDLKQTDRGCRQLRLTVTRRCGKAIVERAKKYVPEFEAHPDNPGGIVEQGVYPWKPTEKGEIELTWDECYASGVGPGTLVICRNNGPLIRNCFLFLKNGHTATIQGKADIGQALSKKLKDLIERTGRSNPSAALIKEEVDRWLEEETRREEKREYRSDTRLTNISDTASCLHSFLDRASTGEDALRKIDALFTDEKVIRGVRFSSIHKAKGLEAEEVVVLHMRKRGSKKLKQWQADEEKNLKYVAVTRAISKLLEVYE